MAEKVVAGPISDACGVREAVCVHTAKIFASCQEKDCVEELRFYPTEASQTTLAAAQSVRAGRAELLSIHPVVEPVQFNRGFFTVELTHYYRVVLQAFSAGSARGTEVDGLCVFTKRAILFGGERGARQFTSADAQPVIKAGAALPTAVVEAVDPMLLSARRIDCPGDERCAESAAPPVPAVIAAAFDSPLVLTAAAAGTRIYVTLGQFSVVRLERGAALLIPTYDYCPPACSTCDTDIDGGTEDPCELFDAVRFPTEQFFPAARAGC